MLPIQAEAYSVETFNCGQCGHDFQAPVATWVDASRTPWVKTLLKRQEFNMVHCPHCGRREFSGSPFFYEDFAEGLMIAVFPTVPDNYLSLQEEIRRKYGYYPILEFFYDMTQLWLLIYLQDYYGSDKSADAGSKVGSGENRLGKFLRFLKMDPLMLTIRETLADTATGDKTNEELQNVLWRALAKIEGTLPGSRDAANHAGSASGQGDLGCILP